MLELNNSIQKYRASILRQAKTVVYTEAEMVLELLKTLEGFLDRLQQYYIAFHPFIVARMRSPIEKLSAEAAALAQSQAKKKSAYQVLRFDEKIKALIDDFLLLFGNRYIGSSWGQILAIINEFEDIEKPIIERAGQWVERRPLRVATNESTRAANFIFSSVVWAYGLSTVWRTVGTSCPYCTSLNGRRIGRGASYLSGGDILQPEGSRPMNIYGKVTHPPLHFRCDCILGVG
jgi:hypothetical protein